MTSTHHPLLPLLLLLWLSLWQALIPQYQATKPHQQALSYLTGGLTGLIVGGEKGLYTGADIALSAEVNNRQLHQEEIKWINENARSKGSGDNNNIIKHMLYSSNKSREQRNNPMPRKPRIEIDGFYHIVNRGVEQRVVFEDKEDYEYFEELMCFYAQAHNITIHNYCLMSNHYHLLIEVKGETLSKYMRQLNMNYAIYFNKKHHRSGHLWQGRFKSWFVTDEAYLYTLILYIENNPVKAGIVTVPEAYPYSSANYLLSHEIPQCLQNSWVARNFSQESQETIREFFHSQPDIDQLSEMKKAASLVEAPNTDKKPNEDKLRSILQKVKDKKGRNALILQCYEQGYSQHMIAKVLGISQPAVNGIVQREKKKVIVIT